MNKTIKFLITGIFIFAIMQINCVYAYEGIQNYLNSHIVTSFGNEKTQIKNTLDKLNEYSNKHDLDKVKTFYSSDFISYDGFETKDYFEMVDATFKTYPDIKFKSKIKKINIQGEWAAVELSDTSFATIKTLAQNIEGANNTIDNPLDGKMEGKCDYVLFLRKIGPSWKIYTDCIITEETSIKYGIANKINMELINPPVVKQGEEYCIKLKLDYPKDSFVLASLNKENVIYPPSKTKEVFRQYPSDAMLERVVRANKTGVNEYSVASVGITKFLIEGNKLSGIKMAGIALLMKRVNIYDKKNVSNKDVLTGRMKTAI